MAKRVRKLTPNSLKRMIQQEARRLQRETSDPLAAGIDDSAKVKAEETDADELAGSLEKDVDYIKALKIHEKKLRRDLRRIKEAKIKLGQRIADKI